MNKRKKFLLSSAVLSLGLLVLQIVPLDYRYVAVFGFFLVTYLVSAWALFDDLKGVEWLTILTLPAFYAVGVSLFYYLLPGNAWSRFIILFLFGFGLYAIYLTENIYSVAAIRTIQLLRAAHAVGFLITVLTLVLSYNTIFSLRWPWWLNGISVVVITIPLLIQALWSVKLDEKLGGELVFMSLMISLCLGEVAGILSFLPVTVWIASLFLATVMYVVLGLLQHALEDRLFNRTIWEYLSVGVLVLMATLIVTPWK
jgi:hypothetical protein